MTIGAFLLGVWVGGFVPVWLLARRWRTTRHYVTQLPPAERRAEELHLAKLDTEHARAELLRMRKLPREEQLAAERRAYIIGATEQAARDQEDGTNVTARQ